MCICTLVCTCIVGFVFCLALAVQGVKPLDEVNVEDAVVKSVSWEDIFGNEEAKKGLQMIASLPKTMPHLYKDSPGGGARAMQTILMYGPPGTGKTTFAKALQTEMKAKFVHMDTAQMKQSPFVGTSARYVRSCFQTARDHVAQGNNAILFLDEMELSVPSRDKSIMTSKSSETEILTTLLTELDGVASNNEGLIVVGATNKPWNLDDAILSRFRSRVYVELPSAEDRVKILQNILPPTETDANPLKPKDYEELLGAAAADENPSLKYFSARDLASLVEKSSVARRMAIIDAKKWRKILSDDGNDYILQPLRERDGGASEEVDANIIELPFDQVVANEEYRTRTALPVLSVTDLKSSLQKVTPTTTEEDLRNYEDYKKHGHLPSSAAQTLRIL